jgi:hypothetical protein
VGDNGDSGGGRGRIFAVFVSIVISLSVTELEDDSPAQDRRPIDAVGVCFLVH